MSIIADIISWLEGAWVWLLGHVWWLIVTLALLFSPILRKVYKGIKNGILGLFTYEGIISLILMLIILTFIAVKIGLINW